MANEIEKIRSQLAVIAADTSPKAQAFLKDLKALLAKHFR